MSRLTDGSWAWVDGTHGSRMALLEALTDADLSFSPGGSNPPLGVLCREMGDVQQSYIDSFKTFTQDWTYRHPDSSMATSLSRLKAWYQDLDQEMKRVIEGFNDADMERTIDRSGYSVTPSVQMDIYLQALLIFFAKVVVYLRAQNRTLPAGMADWIG